MMRAAPLLNAVGWHQARLGHYEPARASCEQALMLFGENSNRKGQAATLDALDYTAHHCEQYAEALVFYRDSLALYRVKGSS
jgi:hypothetical protein